MHPRCGSEEVCRYCGWGQNMSTRGMHHPWPMITPRYLDRAKAARSPRNLNRWESEWTFAGTHRFSEGSLWHRRVTSAAVLTSETLQTHPISAVRIYYKFIEAQQTVSPLVIIQLLAQLLIAFNRDSQSPCSPHCHKHCQYTYRRNSSIISAKLHIAQQYDWETVCFIYLNASAFYGNNLWM